MGQSFTLKVTQLRRLAHLDRSAMVSLGGTTMGMGTDFSGCLLYTSDAADERSSVDLGGRRIINKKKRT